MAAPARLARIRVLDGRVSLSKRGIRAEPRACGSGRVSYGLRKRLEVCGGASDGGVTATAPCYGYEATGALHDQTIFLEETEVYMRFQGPLQFVDAEGQTVGVIGWEQVQAAWDASLA